MLEKIKILRNDLKDPKKKSIAQLIIFGIFFFFVFLLLGISNNHQSINYTDLEEKKEIEYTYNYKIDDITIEGSHTKDLDTFTYNNIIYTLKNNIYVDDSSNEFIIDNIPLNKFSYDSIESIIKKYDFIESTTYKDSTVKTTYTIKTSEFDVTSSVDMDIIIYKDSNKFITKVEMNYNNKNIVLEYIKKDE